MLTMMLRKHQGASSRYAMRQTAWGCSALHAQFCSATHTNVCRQYLFFQAACLLVLVQVTDFGLSRVMCDGMTHLFTNTVGTITHQPPELMGSGHFSKAADVFSFGVLMWEVFMCAQPWKGKLIGEIIALVLVEGHRLQFSPLIPKAYADLAVQCWAEAPTARPTFADIVARLQQLAEVEDELQAEVARAYGNVVQSWAVHSDAEDE